MSVPSEKELYLRALEIDEARERTSFLREACEGDPGLLARIKLLLDLETGSEGDGFLESDPVELVDALASTHGDPSPPADAVHLGKFGDYDLLEVIAHGAMGVVYKAHQRSLNRVVAVKMIRGSLLASEKDVLRFLNEAEAAAQLDHPNIVPIHEIGECEGEHFFTMKLVEGGTLVDHLRRLRSDPRAAAGMLEKVARAVSAAHQRGIIHRDLKPANILVDEEGEPHVSDFGLAKQLEGDQGLTLTGQIMGTPYYMAPEQAGESGGGVTTAVDVYALGAILYEVLAGRPPFKGDSVLDTLKQVREEAAPTIRSFEAGVDRDLETITLKCLSKRPRNRYHSAESLADELARWRHGEPITARPVTGIERALKWIKRRPVYAALWGTAVSLLLLLGIGGPLVAIQQARLTGEAKAATTLAEKRARENERNLYAAKMNLALEAARESEGLEALMKITEDWIPDKGDEDLRGWEWFFLRSLGRRENEMADLGSHIHVMRFSPDGEMLAVSTLNRTLLVFFYATDRKPIRIDSLASVPECLAWCHDSSQLAVGGRDGFLRVYDAETWNERSLDTGSSRDIYGVSWTESGDHLAVSAGKGGGMMVVDSRTGGELQRYRDPEKRSVRQVEWRPGDKEIATGFFPDGVGVWDVATQSLKWAALQSQQEMLCSEWSPDGELLACAGVGQTVWILNGDTGEIIHRMEGATHYVRKMAWSQDGRTLATIGDRAVRLWDVKRGVSRGVLPGHKTNLWALAWRPKEDYLVSGDSDGVIKAWDAEALELKSQNARTLIDQEERIQKIDWSPDSKRLASAGRDGQVRVWDVSTGDPEWEHHAHDVRGGATGVDWSSDGELLATSGRDGKVLIWDYRSRSVKSTLITRHSNGNQIYGGAVFTPDQNRLISSGKAKSSVWNLSSPSSPEFEIPHLRYYLNPVATVSPLGRMLGSRQRDIFKIWDAQDGQFLREFEVPSAIMGYAWSRDERWLAVAGSRGIHVWDLTKNEDPIILDEGHSGLVIDVDWSPDGSRLVSGGRDATCRIWDPKTGQQLLVLRGHASNVLDVAWSPDGRMIASCGHDGMVKIWDASKGYEEQGMSPNVPAVVVAPLPVAPLLTPLPRAFAPNDFKNQRPLYDALQSGFCGVEVDVFLVDGELRVGFEKSDLRPGRTLESLYLKPLSERVRKNGDGNIYRGKPERFILLIDVKSEAEKVYPVLDALLTRYSHLFVQAKPKPGPVTVIWSGNRSREILEADEERYCFLDGRVPDLDPGGPPPALMPVISDRWDRHFSWKGKGEIPPAEFARLQELVIRVHAGGRRLRFWGIPYTGTCWKVLHEAGVDLLGSGSDVSGLEEFLRGKNGSVLKMPGK